MTDPIKVDRLWKIKTRASAAHLSVCTTTFPKLTKTPKFATFAKRHFPPTDTEPAQRLRALSESFCTLFPCISHRTRSRFCFCVLCHQPRKVAIEQRFRLDSTTVIFSGPRRVQRYNLEFSAVILRLFDTVTLTE